MCYYGKNTVIMSTLCIISFGDSEKFRLSLPDGSSEIRDIQSEVKSFLNKKYPNLAGLNYYDAVTVTPVAPQDAAQYDGYPVFNESAVTQIKHTLEREVENYENQRVLNRNAPWSEIEKNAL